MKTSSGIAGKRRAQAKARRIARQSVAALSLSLLLGGCFASTSGPERLLPAADEVAGLRAYFTDNNRIWSDYLAQSSNDAKLSYRNEVISARMYAVDLAYTNYETALLRDGQLVDFGTKVTGSALTALATLAASVGTKNALDQAALVVNGVDVAYNDKMLRTQILQNVQASMRIARHDQAAVIYANMSCPISIYTMGMAFSDLEAYYRAGTFQTGLIKLMQTVSKAETDAKANQDSNRPNPTSDSVSTLEGNAVAADTKARAAGAKATGCTVVQGAALRQTSSILRRNPIAGSRRIGEPVPTALPGSVTPRQ